MIRILLAEDDEIMRITVKDRLEKYGWLVDVAKDGREALAQLEQNTYRLVISDIKMPYADGLELLKWTREAAPYTDIMLMTGYGSVESAINCLQQGAAEYMLKPFDMDDLVIRVNRILSIQNLKARTVSLEDSQLQRGRLLIGTSAPMRELRTLIGRVAASDASVLITGESGTGKELVAEAIHNQSGRHNQPYIKLNCAAIPDGLMEAEMFGHEKGAFTGAVRQKIGRFEMASGGAILLDEIADLPLALQPKLLRVLQERELERVGGSRTVKIDVRIICSTAKKLDAEVEKGAFRRDLLYRLRVIPIVVPPLRERREDIPQLVAHFLHAFSLKRGVAMSLASEAMELLLAYDYPGNVRELRNIIERASVLAPDAVIGVGDLPADLGGKDQAAEPGDSPLLADVVARAEKQAILRALAKTGGAKSSAAEMLGISRKNLWEKMKLYAMG